MPRTLVAALGFVVGSVLLLASCSVFQERWGEDGGGYWLANGDPSLDQGNTYAFCVAA